MNCGEFQKMSGECGGRWVFVMLPANQGIVLRKRKNAVEVTVDCFQSKLKDKIWDEYQTWGI